MRIPEYYIEVIKKSILPLDKKAEIFLFGSRTDNNKKGGDIDILIVSEKLSYNDTLKIKGNIFRNIEEQKIDLVIAKKNELYSPFFKIIMPQAVRL